MKEEPVSEERCHCLMHNPPCVRVKGYWMPAEAYCPTSPDKAHVWARRRDGRICAYCDKREFA